jgi:hypothetical protein
MRTDNLRFVKFGIGLVSLSVGMTVLAWGQQSIRIPEHGQEQLAGLMRAKLSSSQCVVEGLMAGDFSLIRKGGDDLIKVCDAEEWRTREDQVYAHYRGELRRSAIKLIKQADEKSLDGAAYTYMHSMTTCISCHEYCRNVLRVASAIPQSPVAPIPVTEQENLQRQYGTLYR